MFCGDESLTSYIGHISDSDPFSGLFFLWKPLASYLSEETGLQGVRMSGMVLLLSGIYDSQEKR